MKLPLICVLAAAWHANAQPAANKPAPDAADVSYGSHERHRLDLWQAAATDPTPLVIFIHGGGWAGGDKRDVPPELLSVLLPRGISVASINYRLTKTDILPAPVHDAARAVQFLRSQADKWKLDAQRFGAYGISAGGCSTLWLACHEDLAQPRSRDPVARESSRLQVAVGMSPQTCLEPETVVSWVGGQVLKHAMIARAVGAKKLEEMHKSRAEWNKLLREFSPITHVSKDDPPMLLSFPRADPLPATSAGSAIHHAVFGIKLQEQVRAVGGSCVLRIEDQAAAASLPIPMDFLMMNLIPR